jgi:hypothetical protein
LIVNKKNKKIIRYIYEADCFNLITLPAFTVIGAVANCLKFEVLRFDLFDILIPVSKPLTNSCSKFVSVPPTTTIKSISA